MAVYDYPEPNPLFGPAPQEHPLIPCYSPGQQMEMVLNLPHCGLGGRLPAADDD